MIILDGHVARMKWTRRSYRIVFRQVHRSKPIYCSIFLNFGPKSQESIFWTGFYLAEQVQSLLPW